MKVGDIIECNSGLQGLVVDVEMMYPRHPESPVGMLHVYWSESSREKMGLRGREPVGKISPFSIKKVVARA